MSNILDYSALNKSVYDAASSDLVIASRQNAKAALARMASILNTRCAQREEEAKKPNPDKEYLARLDRIIKDLRFTLQNNAKTR